MSRSSSPRQPTNHSAFGAPLTECKLQTTNVEMCVSFFLFISLILVKAFSFSYHAPSGTLALGLYKPSQVDFWQTNPYIAPASQVAVPAQVCVRKRLAKATEEIKRTGAFLEKADSGLRQQLTRVQELNRSIADLEAKCAHLGHVVV